MEGCFNYDNVASYLRDFVCAFNPPSVEQHPSTQHLPSYPSPPPPPPPPHIPSHICMIPLELPIETHRYDLFAVHGPDVKTIAKLVESSMDIPFSSSIREYLKINRRTSKYVTEYEQEIHKFATPCIQTNNIYKHVFIRRLFEYHATLYNISVQQAIKKFLPELEEHYTPNEYHCIHSILRDVEWEWIDEDWVHPAKKDKI